MSAAHDLSITRRIDAPVDAVWRAWTEHFAEWWCPRPWITELIAQELCAGGRSAMIMHGPAGEAHPIEGVCLEVVPHRRIVATDAFAHGWVPQQPFMVRIDTFAEEAGGTRYTATARHWTAEAKANHEAMGMIDGWTITADQLAEVARKIAG